LIHLDELKLNNDLDYAISLMCKFQIDSSGLAYFKDGIIFTHMESLYEKGNNTLNLHWRDAATSIFNEGPNISGMIEATLKLNGNFDFETLEGDVLKVSIFNPAS
jgi:hypothetical protein